MNYRHAFHAGNFADVLKHAVLSRILLLMQKKDSAVRFFDIHAGRGVYDLGSGPASRTGEWQDGIGRLLAEPLPEPLKSLLGPYLDAIAAASGETLTLGKRPKRYPGSPAVVRYLARRQDRLTLTELHPDDRAALADLYAGDVQVKVIELDGWLALKGFLPPKERRGLVLIDPPFEEPREFERIIAAVVDAHRRFATGVQMIWYPIKDPREVRRFRDGLVSTGLRRILSVEMALRQPVPDGDLVATGLIILNPPWTLDEELRQLVPALARCLALGPGGGALVEWLAGE